MSRFFFLGSLESFSNVPLKSITPVRSGTPSWPDIPVWPGIVTNFQPATADIDRLCADPLFSVFRVAAGILREKGDGIVRRCSCLYSALKVNFGAAEPVGVAPESFAIMPRRSEVV